jgi:branched-chain amino acid transport system substrate-binding protein
MEGKVMSEKQEECGGLRGGDSDTGTVSRREFLKLAGIAGAAVGVGAGLGGLVAACGGDEETTTTAGETTTTAAAETTTTAAGETTTTAAGAEMGREVKIGWVTMTTGVFAGLSEPDDFLLNQAKETIGDGLVCADGLKHPIAWIVKDSQSDTNRAAEVAGELITQDKPDIVFGGMTPVVNIPVGQQCEANGVPCITYGCPMEPWFVGMGGNPGDPTAGFKWAFNVFFSVGNLNQVYLGLLDLLPTNKKVACMWPNDPDGEATADPELGMPPVLEGGGYTLVFPGLFTQGTEDYSSVINQFKAEGCECLVGTWTPPDFANFWKQCVQNGFSPKSTAIARAILTRPDMDAVGDIANGLCLEVWWEKTWPFTSSLTGLTCQGIVDAWAAANSGPYTPALGLTGGGGFDTVTDVVKRTVNLDDPASYVEAIKATDLQTILGPVKFDAPFANCALSPLVGGQWIGSVGNWERYVVDNSNYPEISKTADIVDRTTL